MRAPITPPDGWRQHAFEWPCPAVHRQRDVCANVPVAEVDPPSDDPSPVVVATVDRAAPHVAEVYAHTPVPVDAATASVANRECAAAFVRYTGQSMAGSPLTIGHLIDSNQDRTVANPQPSTVICLSQAATGQRSEHRRNPRVDQMRPRFGQRGAELLG